jgi:hypothetical protein
MMILTVDPGVFTMGACLWDAKKFLSEVVCFPVHAIDWVIKDKDRHSLYTPECAMAMHVDKLRLWFDREEITDCYCEKPQVFLSARGFASSIKGHVQQMKCLEACYTHCVLGMIASFMT